MTKIYTDTNWYIDFYRLGKDEIDVLEDLSRHKSRWVITRQTIDEFHRNRVAALKSMIAEFKNTVAVKAPHSTPIIRTFQEYRELGPLLDAYKKKTQSLLGRLHQLVSDEKSDPVAQKVMALWNDGTLTTLENSEALIDKAFRRKLVGQPPRSSDKNTVGDELIWETLLSGMKEDLIVVTRDHNFLENQRLLSAEFSARTGRSLLLVTEKFSAALETLGLTPSERLIKVEKTLPEIGWVTKGSGRHADILLKKIERLISKYAGDVELETGEELSGDQCIVPIKRLIGSQILEDCDQIESEIRRDLLEEEEGDGTGSGM
jgi:hypothetical protein